MTNIKGFLQSLGLDEKEAALYLASLELGEANMTELAKKAELKRTTAYLAFESLERRGLMGSFKMRSGLKFVPTRPEILVDKTQKQLDELKTILPELKAISQKPESTPKIYYYEGEEGYLTAAEGSLQTPNSTVRHIGSLKETHNVITLDYDTKYYIPARIKKHIFIKALYYASETEEEIKQRKHAEELREIRYLPEKYICKTSVLIYQNTVAIFSAKKELITVIIESPEIAEGERRKFDLIWDLLEKRQ